MKSIGSVKSIISEKSKIGRGEDIKGKIRTAVIGCGRTANELHGLVLLKHPGFCVTAACDINREAAEKYGGMFSCKTFTSHSEMLDSDDFDFVIVLTYSNNHAEIALDFLNAGKNVMITKPWALNVKDADTIIEASRENGVMVMPFIPCHFGSDLAKLKEVVAAGTIGKVFQIRRSQVTFGKRSDWQTLKAYGGGYLNNWGPHLLDQVLAFVDEPVVQVYADTKQVINPGDAEDMFYAILKTKSGVLVNVEYNIMTEYLPNWVVQGDKGTIYMTADDMEIHEVSYPVNDDPSAYRSTVNVSRTQMKVEGKRFGDHYAIYTHLENVLRGKEPYIVSLDYARHLTEVICAIHESADCGKLIKI
ncbi:MAG: Gfo/Idh/MocA family oxidoreductase [Eubacteriales bacterium]|nr:Gfo/Idh/MocA family oxidoreductase [Eubacteriales bacterium]